MNPRVRVEVGKQRGAEYEIPPQDEKESVVLGRGTFCDIRLFDMQLSRRHSQFINDGRHLYVEDLGSKNGTFVNGERIPERTELEDGDRITVGSCSLVVENVSALREQETAARRPGLKSELERLAEDMRNLEGKELGGVSVGEKMHEGDIWLIYKAQDKESGQPCVLRLIKPDAKVSVERKNRCIRGAKYAAQFHHPHMARVYKGAKHQDVFYVVMEYVEGESLQKLVEDLGAPLELKDALAITSQILSTVQAAYGKGLVLRSIRPDNVLIGEDLNVKLTDFELIKPVPTEEEKQVTRIVDGNINVDPSFAAPELIAYPVVADQRADVFGVGACLYFMLTGSPPFSEWIPPDQITRVFFRQVRDPRALNPNIPEGIVQIVQKAMAEQPHDRYRDAQEMLAEVEKVQSPH